MAATNRVKCWRDAKRDSGLKAVTVWLTQEEECRLKEIARQWHCSPSTVMQRALAHLTPHTPSQSGSPPDTLLRRELIRAELARMQVAQPPITDTVTVTVTATPESETAGEVESAREYVIVSGNSVVTDTGKGAVPDTGAPNVPTALAPAVPEPTAQTAPALPEAIRKIAAARTQYDTMSERAFTQLLFDRGLYRHRAQDGSEVPLPHSTLRDWLQRARDAGVL
jgi:hypothetical protein